MSISKKKNSASRTGKASARTPKECPYCAQAREKHEELRAIIREMYYALELCLESNGLTWEAEQEADPIVKRIKQSGLLD